MTTINGKDYYLGRYGTQERKAENQRLLAEFLSGGLQAGAVPPDLTVHELAAHYLKFADGYYLKNGQPTTEPVDIGFSIKPLRQLYGHTLASEFGPIWLKAVRHGLLTGLRTILSDVEKASTREPLEIAGDCPPLTIVSQGAPPRSRMPVALAWLFLGIVGWLVFGPLYFRALRPPHDRITDYFQDWASAHNHLTGRPVYTEHTTSLPLYVLSMRHIFFRTLALVNLG